MLVVRLAAITARFDLPPGFPLVLLTECFGWPEFNSLHCSSISGFKRRLKTLLFRQTFSSTT